MKEKEKEAINELSLRRDSNPWLLDQKPCASLPHYGRFPSWAIKNSKLNEIVPDKVHVMSTKEKGLSFDFSLFSGFVSLVVFSAEESASFFIRSRSFGFWCKTSQTRPFMLGRSPPINLFEESSCCWNKKSPLLASSLIPFIQFLRFVHTQAHAKTQTHIKTHIQVQKTHKDTHSNKQTPTHTSSLNHLIFDILSYIPFHTHTSTYSHFYFTFKQRFISCYSNFIYF